MSTAPFPKPARPFLVPAVQRPPVDLPLGTDSGNLTIRRISRSHHGRTLEMLGHAAEHLASGRGFLVSAPSKADVEAVRILRRLSSAVFREYADRERVRRPVVDFVMGCANRLLE